MDIITRNDNTQKVFLSEGTLDVSDILHSFYLILFLKNRAKVTIFIG